jgi:iron complex outermembrane receptor protein
MLDQSKLEVDLSFYNNNVYDQIMGVPLSSTVGANNIRINAGNVRNWGYELYTKYSPIVTPTYRWDVTFTAANQYSKVVKLYPGITRKPLGGGGYTVVAEEGKRMGEILMYDYVKDDKGNRIVGSNGLYSMDTKEMTPINKNINPDFLGGLTTTFFWKGLSLYAGLDYKFGGSIFSYSNYYLTGLGLSTNTLKYRDEAHGGLAYYINTSGERVKWEHNQPAPADARDGTVYHNGLILPGVKVVDGKSVPNDQIANSSSYYQSYISDMSDAFQRDALYKNDYIKLRELALSYTLPSKWSKKVKMEKVTVQAIARNLFYLYKTLPNVDAESTLGTSGTASYQEQSYIPTIRTYGFGINFSF